MFVIVTYDVNEKIVNKIRKLLKKYLIWTQNSVFEGEITQAKMHKCISEIEKMICKGRDSVYVYEIQNPRNIEKKVYGIQKNFDELFL